MAMPMIVCTGNPSPSLDVATNNTVLSKFPNEWEIPVNSAALGDIDSCEIRVAQWVCLMNEIRAMANKMVRWDVPPRRMAYSTGRSRARQRTKRARENGVEWFKPRLKRALDDMV